MRELNYNHSVAISVDHVFDWFKNLDKNYLTWHPQTHKNFQWLSEKPVMKGSVFLFEEQIKGHNHKMLMKISEFVENQQLSFSSIKIFTSSKYLPGWLFSILISIFRIKMEMIRSFEPETKQLTTVRLTHKFGSPIPIIGRIVDYITERFIFSSKNHLEHIKEESFYMKNDLENKFIAGTSFPSSQVSKSSSPQHPQARGREMPGRNVSRGRCHTP